MPLATRSDSICGRPQEFAMYFLAMRRLEFMLLRMNRILLVAGMIGVCAASCFGADQPGLPPGVVVTQNPKDKPIAPEEALRRMTVPDGFSVSLFAGEPDVMQPIAFDFDDRGRVWVVENFSYPDWKTTNRDRILILTDKDGDGRFDERKIFFDKGHRLSSVVVGFGGVWATSPPELL